MSGKRFEQNLNDLARHMPRHTLDVSVRERTLRAVFTSPILAPQSGWMIRRTLGIAGGILAVAALSLIAGTCLVPAKSASAAEVRRALARVNTWHLTGWKLQNGKQVRWEVWGRRIPFFYREQIGQNVTLDNGKERIRLFAAPRWDGGKEPLIALKMPTRPIEHQAGLAVGAGNHTQTSIISPDSFLDAIGQRGSAYDTVLREGNTLTLRRNDGGIIGANLEEHSRLMTVDMRTKLPWTFTWHVDRSRNPNVPKDAFVAPAKSYDSGYLEAAYDVPLQETITDIPADATMVDMTVPTEGFVPTENAITVNGLTVQAKEVIRDQDGNLLLRFGAWLGQKRMDAETAETGLGLNVRPSPVRQIVEHIGDRIKVTTPHTAMDERGNIYVEIGTPPRIHHSDRPELYFAPLEPLPEGTPSPNSLSLSLQVSLESWELNPETHNGTRVPMMEEVLKLNLTLPQTAKSLGYDIISNEDCLAPSAHRWTMKEHILQSRASYYSSTAHDDPKLQKRAQFWYEESLREAKRTKNKMLESLARQNLKLQEDRINRWEKRTTGNVKQ